MTAQTQEKPKAKAYKLSVEEKTRIANKINYFRIIPTQVLKTAGDLENGVRTVSKEVVTHDIKSVLVNGRVMLLNII
jgi:hypothetical protein